ncbi:MAG: hypothetical protein K2W96_27200 [Gemmataceae bacterium]|nr:hypothetical protein [Gemmataceae bacterium]
MSYPVLGGGEAAMWKKRNLYTGGSGQSAIGAEFLRRGYNVGKLTIDVGDDFFVLRDSDAKLWRIQAKSALARGKGPRKAGQYGIPMAQLIEAREPDLHYVLAAHRNGLWRDFLVIPRERLLILHQDDGIGNVVEGKLVLYIAFTDTDAVCSGVSLQGFRDDWSEWPEIDH